MFSPCPESHTRTQNPNKAKLNLLKSHYYSILISLSAIIQWYEYIVSERNTEFFPLQQVASQNCHLYQCHIDFHVIFSLIFQNEFSRFYSSFILFQCTNVEAVQMQEMAEGEGCGSQCLCRETILKPRELSARLCRQTMPCNFQNAQIWCNVKMQMSNVLKMVPLWYNEILKPNRFGNVI